MISGDKLSNSKFLCHFVLVCILFVLLIIEWAFQLGYFDKMNPYYGKGGPFSKTSYYITVFVWVFNMIGIICLIASIILYFVAEYWLGPKGKDVSSMRNSQDIFAVVCFGFVITSSVFGFLVSIIGIIPDAGLYSKGDDSYTHYFLGQNMNSQLCSLGAFEVAQTYGKKFANGDIDMEEYVNVHLFFSKIISVVSQNFAPICSGLLIPMMVICFLVMIFASVVKCFHKGFNRKEQVSNAPNPTQPPQGQYAYQQGQYPNQPPPGQYAYQQGQYPNQPPPGQYAYQQGQYPNQPPPGQYAYQPPQGQYPNQPPQGQYPNQPPPGQYPNQVASGQPPEKPSANQKPDGSASPDLVL